MGRNPLMMVLIGGLLSLGLVVGVHAYSLGWRPFQKGSFVMTQNAGGVPFAALPGQNNPYPNEVIIAAAINCPHEAAQKADMLYRELYARGIPVRRVDQVSLHFDSAYEADQIQKMMSAAQLPQVFINGRLRGNPSLDDVLAEVQRQSLPRKTL